MKMSRSQFLTNCGLSRGYFMQPLVVYIFTYLMKGTKVLTLGAGREVLPHNMAVTKM